uniref:Uncharacterized protein n=1 Tax=Arundo donax TaxID=35708 RepID=A0A0A9EBF6_ARUDO
MCSCWIRAYRSFDIFASSVGHVHYYDS